MGKFLTSFGEVTIRIDGKSVPYFAKEGRKQNVLCPHVLGRYQIAVIIPHIAEWLIIRIAVINYGLRDFIKS